VNLYGGGSAPYHVLWCFIVVIFLWLVFILNDISSLLFSYCWFLIDAKGIVCPIENAE